MHKYLALFALDKCYIYHYNKFFVIGVVMLQNESYNEETEVFFLMSRVFPKI